MTQTETWTVGRLLEWTTDYLKQHGAESPRLDAEVLLAECRSCQRIELYTAFNEPVDDEPRARFRELVRERATGVPVAYLVGRREFYSLPFRVSRDVLIPRPETEFLVIRLLELAGAREGRNRPSGSDGDGRNDDVARRSTICDVGTGSGIVAVCAAVHLPGCRVVAVDVSPAALEVAASNASDHGVSAAIEFLESDLLAGVPHDQRFDFVVSNPPYVTTAEMEGLPPDVRLHEPRLALEAGPKGTEVIARLVPQAADRLKPGGWLLLEISPMIEAAVRSLIEHDGRFELGPTIKDLAGFARVVQARRK